MNQAIKNLVSWIVVSSADQNEVSLATKGILLGAVPTIMAVAGLAHVNLGDGSIISALFDTVAQLIQAALTVISLAMTTFGMLRKVYFLVFPGNTISHPQS